MEPEVDEAAVVQKVRAHGQQHVLRWLDELNAAQRRNLLGQLAAVDLDQWESFHRMLSVPPTRVSLDSLMPAPVAHLPLRPEQIESERNIRALGERALRDDRVCALTAAGGQGTRLGYDHPKGTYPISPLRGLSLFHLFAEQVAAARRRYGSTMPWLIMTSESNDARTRSFFEENDFFQLGADTVHFFVQDENPIVDLSGNLLLVAKDRLLTGPNGHGGMFAALVHSGLTDKLRQTGQDLISYFQVDNPLVAIADQRFIGHHLGADADFSCKVVPKRDPQERLGIAVTRLGRPAIIEYCDIPPSLAAKRGPRGQLWFPYGNIAIHVIDVPFVERVVQQDALEWHVAHRQYEIVDQSGRTVLSAPDGCCKFERFIFDAMAFADRCVFVEVQRGAQFAPVKNAEGEDSPQTARHMMQRQWLRWLQAAGAQVEMPREFREPMIEISPLFAADEAELKERIQPGCRPSFPLVLEP